MAANRSDPVPETELLLQACSIASHLADIAAGAGQDVAAAHFSHGADILRAHADLLGFAGQKPLN